MTATEDGGLPVYAMVCYARCESCQSAYHYDTPRWHSWAGEDDVAHAAATGQANPSSQRCGCPCAGNDVVASL